MSEIRQQLQRARADYTRLRYPGDLAAEAMGEVTARRRRALTGGGIAAGMAAAAVLVLLLGLPPRNGGMRWTFTRAAWDHNTPLFAVKLPDMSMLSRLSQWPCVDAIKGKQNGWLDAMAARFESDEGEPLLLRQIESSIPDSYEFEVITEHAKARAQGLLHWLI